MPRFIPYAESKEKMEIIQVKFEMGKTPSQIADDLDISRAEVSYYLKKLGLSRPKAPSRGKVPMCVVCRNSPVNPISPYICGKDPCVDILLTTLACSNSVTAFINGRYEQVDSLTKILMDIQHKAPVRFPMESDVCVMDNVTKVFSSPMDHLRYHAYRRLGKRRPPIVLWKDEKQWIAYRERRREEEWVRRNTNSEHPQPKRIRGYIA